MTLEARLPVFEVQPSPKSVMMPGSIKIIAELQNAGLYTRGTRNFYDLFAKSVGGMCKTGPALNTVWCRALTNTTLGAEQDRVDKQFNAAIDTITPDPEVASDAKKTWAKIKEETRQKALR